MENNEVNEHESTQVDNVAGAGQQPASQEDKQPQSEQQQQPAEQPVQQQAPQPTSQPHALPSSGLAIAGMVLGIVALVLVFVPVINIVSPVLAIVGLVLSIVGLQGIRNGKKSGKGMAIAGIVTCAIVAVIAILMTASCSAFLGSLTAGGAKQASSSSKTAESNFVGTWDVVEFEIDNKKTSESEINTARKNGYDSFFVFDKGGSLIFVVGGQREDGTWQTVDASTVKITINGGSSQLTLKDDVLSTQGLKLRKGTPRSASAIPPANNGKGSSSSSASSSSSSASSSSEVSPDLKEFLDSYEAFADEYVSFMKEYVQSGSPTSMMQRYLSIMQRYGDFANKLEKYDESKMSPADAAYFAEVSARISKKLLEAMS